MGKIEGNVGRQAPPSGVAPKQFADHYESNFWVSRIEPKLDLIAGWARNGLTNKQISDNLGVGETTLNKYLEERELLRDTIEESRQWAEIHVENAMYKNATGYYYKEVVRERHRVLDEDRQWTGEYEMVVVKETTKHKPGDFSSQQYWLEHRAPKRWEKNPVPAIDPTTANISISTLAQLLSRPVPERAIPGAENE